MEIVQDHVEQIAELRAMETDTATPPAAEQINSVPAEIIPPVSSVQPSAKKTPPSKWSQPGPVIDVDELTCGPGSGPDPVQPGPDPVPDHLQDHFTSNDPSEQP